LYQFEVKRNRIFLNHHDELIGTPMLEVEEGETSAGEYPVEGGAS
jgi:hypothetical protein